MLLPGALGAACFACGGSASARGRACSWRLGVRACAPSGLPAPSPPSIQYLLRGIHGSEAVRD